MPSFATEVKNEIARLMYDAPCDRTAEMAALLRMGGTITFGAHRTFGVNFTTENAAVARKMLNLLKLEGAGVHTEISARRARRLSKHNNYLVRIVPSPGVEGLLEHLGLMQGGSLNLGQEQKGLAILRKNCCRAAYLRGAFLGGGSVNRPEAHYHLELVAPNYAFAHLLHTLMKRLEFPAGIAERRDVYVVYLKEGDAVVDFLGMMQADEAVERFEVARNVKEVREQVNRLVNCETANLQKAVDAAGRQLADIRILERAGAIESLPEQLRETIDARRAHPDLTMSELASLLCVSKPGVNHRLRKLHALAEKYKESATCRKKETGGTKPKSYQPPSPRGDGPEGRGVSPVRQNNL